MMGSSTAQPAAIPFSFFVRLVREFHRIEPRRVGEVSTNNKMHAFVFDQWISGLAKPLPPGTGSVLLKMLFPEHDTDRRYNMQESKLSKYLANVFVVETAPGKRGHRLVSWQDGKRGCLGLEALAVLEETYTGADHPVSPTFAEVDVLLNELAATSQWSDVKHKPENGRKRPAKVILAELFRDLSPFGAAVMTQIILKDLRPLVYCLASPNASSSLLNFNANAYEELSLHRAMRAWHPSMPQVYRTLNTIESAAHRVEELESIGSEQPMFSPSCDPILGTPIEIPKSVKGRSIPYVLGRLEGSERLYAETKYDGERMQIHIDFSRSEQEQIKIFSKSKRDSTWDRVATHSIIRAALGRAPGSDAHEKLVERRVIASPPKLNPQTLILDAEMVPYSEILQDIDEFWRIRSMIEETAIGPRRKPRKFLKPSHGKQGETDSEDEGLVDNPESFSSLVSDGTAGNTRHFMLVFFDVMHYDDRNYLDEPYEERRALLETLIIPIPGFARLAESLVIPTSSSNKGVALKALQLRYEQIRPDREEGIVLKVADSSYNDSRKPWVKLKRDYIAGHGDNVDLVLLGSGWSKDRGRDLGVGPQVETTFYVGCVTNMERVKASSSIRPHFEIFFVAEYGFSREELEDFNARMRCGAVPYEPQGIRGLPYTFTLADCLKSPRTMFDSPILAELTGDRFTKVRGLSRYELRSPRITKLWRKDERDWMAGLSLTALHEIACAAVRRLDGPSDGDSTEQNKKRAREPLEELSSNSIRDTKKLKIASLSPVKRPLRRLRSITNLPRPRAAAALKTSFQESDSATSATVDAQSPSKHAGHGMSENGGGCFQRSYVSSNPRSHPSSSVAGTPALVRSETDRSSDPPSADTTLDTPHRIVRKPNSANFKDHPDVPTSFDYLPVLRNDFTLTESEGNFLHALSTPSHWSLGLDDAVVYFDSNIGSKSLPFSARIPQGNVIFSLDAFFIASGWYTERRLPVRAHFRRAVIFTTNARVPRITTTLEALQEELQERGHNERLRIIVCDVAEVSDESLRPAWTSA